MTLDEFLDELEKTKELDWQTDSLSIRAYDYAEGDDRVWCLCPITAVARAKGLGFYSAGCYQDAAKVLGIHPGVANYITDAADSYNRASDLRYRILARLC